VTSAKFYQHCPYLSSQEYRSEYSLRFDNKTKTGDRAANVHVKLQFM